MFKESFSSNDIPNSNTWEKRNHIPLKSWNTQEWSFDIEEFALSSPLHQEMFWDQEQVHDPLQDEIASQEIMCYFETEAGLTDEELSIFKKTLISISEFLMIIQKKTISEWINSSQLILSWWKITFSAKKYHWANLLETYWKDFWTSLTSKINTHQNLTYLCKLLNCRFRLLYFWIEINQKVERKRKFIEKKYWIKTIFQKETYIWQTKCFLNDKDKIEHLKKLEKSLLKLPNDILPSIRKYTIYIWEDIVKNWEVTLGGTFNLQDDSIRSTIITLHSPFKKRNYTTFLHELLHKLEQNQQDSKKNDGILKSVHTNTDVYWKRHIKNALWEIEQLRDQLSKINDWRRTSTLQGTEYSKMNITKIQESLEIGKKMAFILKNAWIKYKWNTIRAKDLINEKNWFFSDFWRTLFTKWINYFEIEWFITEYATTSSDEDAAELWARLLLWQPIDLLNRLSYDWLLKKKAMIITWCHFDIVQKKFTRELDTSEYKLLTWVEEDFFKKRSDEAWPDFRNEKFA